MLEQFPSKENTGKRRRKTGAQIPSDFTVTPIKNGNTQCQDLCLSQTHRKKPVMTETTLRPVSCSHPKAPSPAAASKPSFQSSAAKFPPLGQTW